MRSTLLSFIFLASFFAQAASGQPERKQAAVAMPDKFAVSVAEQIFKQGGNAVDVAVATGFSLAVTFPEAGNLGGGGFMTLFIEGKPYFLDYREMAPSLASRDMYLDDNQAVIPFKSLVGYQASGVPGTVAGMWAVHQRFGKLSWQQVLHPAIELAEQGFAVPEQTVSTAKWFKGWIAEKSAVPLNFERYFGALTVGETFKQPALAKTLKRLATHGQADFYEGETAALIVKSMQANNGLISKEDLANYEVKWREPIQIEWQDKRVISAPPPSSGGIAIAQLLKMSEATQARFESTKKGMADAETETLRIHWFAEMQKRVYADRAEYLGDADFVAVPSAQLISDAYIEKRVADIRFDEISETEKVKPGLMESPETTHYSIVDAEGNAVSNTYTLNMPFGSGVVIDDAGFLMNNEMDDFSTKPGVANVFGVLGGKANEIAPGKRMLSSMSPTLVLKGDVVDMVVGTPGGSSIITSVFQTIWRHYEAKVEPQENVNMTRVHHQLWPKNRIDYHPELSENVKVGLELMGYQLRKNNYLGDVQLIVQDDGQWVPVSDSRWRGKSKVIHY